MRFEFTEEEEMLRNQIRRLTREKIAPLSNAVAEEEESREIALQIIRLLGDQGFCGLYVPQEFGGAGISSVGICIVREELSKVSHLADVLYAELGLATYGITLKGRGEQKRTYLPRVAKGDLLGSFSLTEPDAGSDVAPSRPGLKRTATPTFSTEKKLSPPWLAWRTSIFSSPKPIPRREEREFQPSW